MCTTKNIVFRAFSFRFLLGFCVNVAALKGNAIEMLIKNIAWAIKETIALVTLRKTPGRDAHLIKDLESVRH